MKIFKLFSRKKKKDYPEIKALKTKRVPMHNRLRESRQKQYIAKVYITYKGKPIRQFETIVKGHSRDNAAYKVNRDLDMKLLSVRQDKRRR